MFRKKPPAREAQVLRELLEIELAELRGLPYCIWQGVVGLAMSKDALGRDDRRYRLSVTPSWAVAGSQDVRVTVALETRSLHRPLMRQSFVITPDNQLIADC
jgi:hypothetical protein